MPLRLRWNVSLLLVSLAAAGIAQTPVPTRTPAPTPTIDQSLEMHNVYTARISPDGKHVVYEQTRTNWEANAFETELWLADTATGESHPISIPVASSNNPRWSPDGRWIAFLSTRPGQIKDSPADKPQLYIMPLDGGEARQITKIEQGVNGFEWSPDSKHIAIAAQAPETKAMKDRKETFGDYQVIHADYQMTHLWLVDLPKTDSAGRTTTPADPRLLTQGDTFSINDFEFSPDGAHIAFSAQTDPDLISIATADIYTVAVADGAVKKLVSTPGPDSNPHWSPDGTQIAYVTSNGSKYFF